MFTKINEDEVKAKFQKRLLWLLVITGCVANMIGFLSNVVFFGMSIPTIVCGICEIIMIICGFIGIYYEKQKIATAIMVFVLAFFEFPFLFYVYGANMGVYLILGIIALAIYFPRPYQKIMIVLNILLDIVIIIVSYLYPSTIEVMTKESQIGTMLCSYIIVAIAAAVIISMLIQQYVVQYNQVIKISQVLEYAANHDALTGVYNRRYLLNTLNQWIYGGKQFLFVLIDVDDFKKVNDTFGHVYGDEVLVKLTEMMMDEMKDKGIVTRYGGEEFMLLFEKPDFKEAIDTLKSIQKSLKEYSMETKQTEITFSGGMVEYNQSINSKIDELFYNADQKLYEAKNGGKNKIVL